MSKWKTRSGFDTLRNQQTLNYVIPVPVFPATPGKALKLLLFKVTFMTQVKGMQRNSILLDYSSCTASALLSSIIFHMLCTMFSYSKQSQHLLCPQKTSGKPFSCLFKQRRQRQGRLLVRVLSSGASIRVADRCPTHPSGWVSACTGATVASRSIFRGILAGEY